MLAERRGVGQIRIDRGDLDITCIARPGGGTRAARPLGERGGDRFGQQFRV